MRYNEIPGYCDYHDFYRDVFEQLPDGATVAEVGVYLGHSVAFMATLAKESGKDITIYAVDTFEGSPEHKNKGLGNFMEQFHMNLHSCGVRDYVYTVEVDTNVDYMSMVPHLDFCFIDANHYYENVKADIITWKPKVKPGGILAGHDYCKSWPGVIEAVDELIPNKQLNKSVWWTRIEPTS